MLSGEGLLVLLALAAGFQALSKTAPSEGDQTAFVELLFLLGALSLLCGLPAPLPAAS
jgi:hypothetical protein